VKARHALSTTSEQDPGSIAGVEARELIQKLKQLCHPGRSEAESRAPGAAAPQNPLGPGSAARKRAFAG